MCCRCDNTTNKRLCTVQIWIGVLLCWFVVGYGATIVGCNLAALESDDHLCSTWNPLLVVALICSCQSLVVVLSVLALYRPPFGQEGYHTLVISFTLFLATVVIAAMSIFIVQESEMHPGLVLTIQFFLLGFGIWASMFWIGWSCPMINPDGELVKEEDALVDAPIHQEWVEPQVRCYTKNWAYRFVAQTLVLVCATLGCVMVGVGCAEVADQPSLTIENISVTIGPGLCQPFSDPRSAVGVVGSIVSFLYFLYYSWTMVRCGCDHTRACIVRQNLFVEVADWTIWTVYWIVVLFVLIASVLAITNQPLLQNPFVTTLSVVGYFVGAWSAVQRLSMEAIPDSDIQPPRQEPPRQDGQVYPPLPAHNPLPAVTIGIEGRSANAYVPIDEENDPPCFSCRINRSNEFKCGYKRTFNHGGSDVWIFAWFLFALVVSIVACLTWAKFNDTTVTLLQYYAKFFLGTMGSITSCHWITFCKNRSVTTFKGVVKLLRLIIVFSIAIWSWSGWYTLIMSSGIQSITGGIIVATLLTSMIPLILYAFKTLATQKPILQAQ